MCIGLVRSSHRDVNHVFVIDVTCSTSRICKKSKLVSSAVEMRQIHLEMCEGKKILPSVLIAQIDCLSWNVTICGTCVHIHTSLV
jgi:hypothetical protein